MSRPTGPHRDLKVQRLRTALEAIPTLARRDPLLNDPEFTEWRNGVAQLLTELFSPTNMLGYTGRFARISFHSTIRPRGLHTKPVFQADFRERWANGLQQAATVIREAFEEAELGPAATMAPPTTVVERREAPIVINVSNTVSNSFSPTVHVTFNQLMTELDSMQLPSAERERAKEELGLIEAETKGNQRWHVIGRSLEAIKAIGKGVYKDIAIPLIVEYLKHQSGVARHPL